VVKNASTLGETHIWLKHLNNLLPRLVLKQPADTLLEKNRKSSNNKPSYFSVQWAVFFTDGSQ
jgi:hypothetical protein